VSEDPFVEVIGTLRRRWLFVVAVTFLAGAIATVYSLVAPKWYAATLSVVPSQRSQNVGALGIAARIPGFETGPTDVQRIEAVLTSNSVADDVIDHFNLTARYGETYREYTRAKLWEHCTTSVNKKSGVVRLTCEDKDPEQAKALATYFGEVGNRVFGRVSSSSAREERAFLEAQVVKAREDVEKSSQALRRFQEQHKLVDLPEQSKAVISAMASIKGDLISKQLELSYLSSFSARTESSVIQLKQQIAILESKLQQLEDSGRVATNQTGSGTGSGSASEKSSSFFPEAMNVPELRYELERLLREQKIQETVFGLLTQRFEMAKVDEARDTSTFQILDYPTLPTYPFRPRRLKLVIMGFMLGLMIAGARVVAEVWWRRRTRPAST
jgi:tyrosine-protein kinase Etk/Wzc